jgi:Flp pilus assembly protein TadD
MKISLISIIGSTCVGITVLAASPDLDRARTLYQHTEYQQSLAVLLPVAAGSHDAAMLQLLGQDYFMLADYKKATEALERAAAIEPDNPKILNWLGRGWGRRAETSGPFTAPGYATKARQAFERSVALDPTSKEATGDLLDYYLDAPGFLGGGMQKAQELARLIARTDAAEGHYAQALIEDRRKEYDSAEQHFRHAAELAPKQVGRFLDLAKYLAKRGRFAESEAVFEHAAKVAPNNPRVLFERASTYVKDKRNLEQARDMLVRYIQAPLTADDPPRQEAEALLKKIS